MTRPPSKNPPSAKPVPAKPAKAALKYPLKGESPLKGKTKGPLAPPKAKARKASGAKASLLDEAIEDVAPEGPRALETPEPITEIRKSDREKENDRGKETDRANPHRKRILALTIGSEHEVGGRLLETLQFEGDGLETVYTNGAFWEYVKKTGLWTEIDPNELHSIVGTFDGLCYCQKPAKHLKISQAFARGSIDRAAVIAHKLEFFSSTDPVLAFKNGIVHVSPSGEIEFRDHSSEHHVRVGYDFDWDPEAQCPRFEQMMQEHFEGDDDASDKIKCEQEFFGACLFGIATTYQKCLALPSDGGSGRSTLLETIEAAFPKETVSHIDVKALRSPERLTRMVGKRLNYSDEVPPDAFIESEAFKQVVVGNIVTAEGKYRASFEYRPIAGHVFPIQISASAELTTAFFRRFIIIRYNKTFEGDPKRVLDLSKVIVAGELPGLVRYLVEGCARVRKQGRYTIPASHEKEAQQWRMDSDTAMAFIGSTCVKPTFKEESDNWTTSTKLYKNYKTWCEINGHNKPVASGRFAERLKKLGIKSKHTNCGTAYNVVERITAETRRDGDKRFVGVDRAARPLIPGYFDKPTLQLVSNAVTEAPEEPKSPGKLSKPRNLRSP